VWNIAEIVVGTERLPTAHVQLFRFEKGQYQIMVAKLALRYKPEDRGFESRWDHWNILLT